MRKFLIICAALFLICASVEARLIEPNSSVAVMDFEPHKGTSEPSVDLLRAEMTTSEYVIQRLAEKNNFLIIDKDLKSEELKNVDILGKIAPEDARKIGKILGVRYIIYGNVLDVSLANDAEAVVNLNKIRAHIITKIMDVETGKILMAAKGEGESTSAFIGDDEIGFIVIGATKVSQTSVHNALQKAAFQAVDILNERLFK